jgi:hypothetical protein
VGLSAFTRTQHWSIACNVPFTFKVKLGNHAGRYISCSYRCGGGARGGGSFLISQGMCALSPTALWRQPQLLRSTYLVCNGCLYVSPRLVFCVGEDSGKNVLKATQAFTWFPSS